MIGLKKRNQDRTNRGFTFPLRYALLVAFIMVIAFSYLMLCTRCEAMGKKIKSLEREFADARKRQTNEEYKWSNLRSPANIEQALVRHQLAMYWPERTKVIHLSSPDVIDEQGNSTKKSIVAVLSMTNSVLPQKVRVAMND